MKKQIDYEERIKRSILKDLKLKRVPSRTNKPRPVFTICGDCKRRPVTNHHYLCNICWRKRINGKRSNKR